MKRFHVHVRVRDLARSVRFYSELFAAEPIILKADYAKWMLEDPTGIQWETFLTVGESAVYGDDPPVMEAEVSQTAACCVPGCCAPRTA